LQVREKEKHLCRLLEQYGKAAVAFSGGADSSLLLWYALQVLGLGKVVTLTSRSCLLKPHELERVSAWFARHDPQGRAVHEFIDITPLKWAEFAANPADRCYLCKSRVYRRFLDRAGELGIDVLMDGTNADDMQSDRPGLRALRELGIETPLARAGFSKEDVRGLSREIALNTWDQPSSSCLATRVPSGMEITDKRISLIAQAESILEEMGFAGCRVRLTGLGADSALIQVQKKDVPRIAEDRNRPYILERLGKIGFSRVILDMCGR